MRRRISLFVQSDLLHICLRTLLEHADEDMQDIQVDKTAATGSAEQTALAVLIVCA